MRFVDIADVAAFGFGDFGAAEEAEQVEIDVFFEEFFEDGFGFGGEAGVVFQDESVVEIIVDDFLVDGLVGEQAA